MALETNFTKRGIAIILGFLPMSAPVAAAEPIIDMHIHGTMSERSKPEEACPGNQPIDYLPVDPGRSGKDPQVIACRNPIKSALGFNDLRRDTISALKRAHVVRAVVMGPIDRVERWRSDAPGMIIPATTPEDPSPASLKRLQTLLAERRIQVVGEIGLQYSGLSADNPKLDDFWAMVERADVPVGIHLGEGMQMAGTLVRTDLYRASLTSPFQLETVLKKHPKLRLYVMHAASPLTDEMIAMLFAYPALHVDISANNWNMPRAHFHAQLQKLVDAGFSKRILFGSDQTLFPQAIGLAIASINEAPFLTALQKRDILYNNAARFLRLTKEQIAADHRQ